MKMLMVVRVSLMLLMGHNTLYSKSDVYELNFSG